MPADVKDIMTADVVAMRTDASDRDMTATRPQRLQGNPEEPSLQYEAKHHTDHAEALFRINPVLNVAFISDIKILADYETAGAH
jgi:hypothetical protein